MAHRKQDEKKEDREAAMTTWSMDYTFLTEDFELLTRTEFENYAHKEKVKDIVLVCDDRRSGGVKAHLVEHKGRLDTWISSRVAEDLAEFGLRGVGVCCKSDEEPAILEVRRKVGEIRCGAEHRVGKQSGRRFEEQRPSVEYNQEGAGHDPNSQEQSGGKVGHSSWERSCTLPLAFRAGGRPLDKVQGEQRGPHCSARNQG